MARRASPDESIAALARDTLACERCPRLVRWRVCCTAKGPLAVRGSAYHSRGVPSFGDPRARLLIVGLAPGAHGANRTGRPFTGDSSGDFLFAALHRAGLSSLATSRSIDDGLELRGARITNAVRCVPPENKPSATEFARCAPLLARELALLPRPATVLCLGGDAWRAVGRLLRERGELARLPRFAHGARYSLDGLEVVGSFHPSRLNTQTGRLTERMFDSVLARATKSLSR
ncbi:MAG: uracil-DNA glycosylase [Planctomycetes bacterium]|nr:uracil-DNA glycosylase [Planctomycetota bacterium]